jgi:membrane associated rhomboid family serine protease
MVLLGRLGVVPGCRRSLGGLTTVFVPIHDDNPLRSIAAPYVTWGLIALNAAIFMFELSEVGQAAMASFAVVPDELRRGGLLGGPRGPGDLWPVPEPLTLLTYAFLHGDVLHLITNMLFLWVFGDNVEDALGHARFAIFYALCAIAGGLAHAIATTLPEYPLIGASGAVAGVISAYVLLHPHVRVWVLVLRVIPLYVTAAVALGAWIITQFGMLILGGPSLTAWWAHAGGIVAGAILVVVLRRPGTPLLSRVLPARSSGKTE